MHAIHRHSLCFAVVSTKHKQPGRRSMPLIGAKVPAVTTWKILFTKKKKEKSGISLCAVIADPHIHTNTHGAEYVNSTQNSSEVDVVLVDSGARRKDLCPAGISSVTSRHDYFQLEGASVCPSVRLTGGRSLTKP